MAEIYAVASMTSQPALRELQTMGLTYGIVGKDTFVHPEALDRIAILDGQPVQTAEGITISAETRPSPAIPRPARCQSRGVAEQFARQAQDRTAPS
jgi:hypothetical protein